MANTMFNRKAIISRHKSEKLKLIKTEVVEDDWQSITDTSKSTLATYTTH